VRVLHLSACYHFIDRLRMHRTALQALSRASLSRSISAVPCTCAHLASPAPSSTSSIASTLPRSHRHISSSLARQRNACTSVQDSNGSAVWRRRWQSTSTSPTTTAAGVKASYPTSGSAPLQSSPVRRRTVNTSLPQIKVSPRYPCLDCAQRADLMPV
jgi:hypothetical protein